VADEICNIYTQNDEWADPFSYLPTARLVLSGLERSKKAALVGSPAPNLGLAAAAAAYGLGRSTVLRKTFAKDGEKELVDLAGLDDNQLQTHSLLSRHLLDKSTKGWTAWIQADYSRDIVSKYFALQVRHFRKDRPKSVEAFLASYVIAYSKCQHNCTLEKNK
jgi:hypothetical protein